VIWETELLFDGQLSHKYSCQKLLKSDNFCSSYSRKCLGCFFCDVAQTENPDNSGISVLAEKSYCASIRVSILSNQATSVKISLLSNGNKNGKVY